MKKFLALLLALTMLLLLAGCKKSESTISEQVKTVEIEETDEEKSLMFTEEEVSEEEPAEEAETPEKSPEEVAEEVPEEEAPEETPAETEQPAEEIPEEETTAEEESDNIEMGSWDGYTFENTTLHYGIALDSNWYPYSDEELLALNNATVDQFDNETIKQQMANADMFCDMAAQKLDGTGFIQCNVENLGVIYGAMLSVDDYIDISLMNLEPALVSAGYTIETIEKVAVTVSGSEMSAIYISGVFSGINIYQIMVPVKTGERIACICVSTYLTDATADMLNCIYLIP